MSILNLPINRIWQVKLPTVIRYMDQQYIDHFFKTGELRFSSFRRFGQHKDEMRHDKMEGMAGLQLNYSMEQTLASVGWFGSEAYVFCTSTIESDELMSKFQTNGYFRIKDTAAFGAGISNHIPDYVIGFEGTCIYRNQRTFRESFDRPLIGTPPLNDPNAAEAWAVNLEQQIHADSKLTPYFLKELGHAEQNEYRFIWCSSSPTDETIDITCPEVIRFCEKVT